VNLAAVAPLLVACLPRNQREAEMRASRQRATWRDNALAALMVMAVALPSVAAWSQHLYTCGAEDRWAFAALGAILFPIGIVHGTGVWFGFWG
jgi:hypothetical protein